MDKYVKRIPKECLKQSVVYGTNSIHTSNVGQGTSVQNDRALGENLAKTAHASFDKDLETELQHLEFAVPLISENYRLIEINPVLADRVMTGEALVIRGEPDDSPVLCTRSTTFDMKEVVTSNALLLLPEFHFNDEANANGGNKMIREVIGMKNTFIELREMTYIPVHRLKEKLHETELEWDSELNKDKKLYTAADLLDIIQMSEIQLQKALEHLPVITLNGYIRLLSAEFHDRLVTELVDYLDDDEEPGIILESVGMECFSEALKKHLPDKNIPVEAVQWLIGTYCNIVEENGTRTHQVNEKAICRAKISQLLRAAVKFEYETFKKTLLQILPIGIEFKEEYLEGLAFVDDELAAGKTIRYLNVEDLPEEPIKRLELLFSLRQPWKESIIQQYLSDLCPTKRLLNEFLMNFCRQSTTVNGEKIVVGLKEALL